MKKLFKLIKKEWESLTFLDKVIFVVMLLAVTALSIFVYNLVKLLINF